VPRPQRFDAVILDLDGVITDTARLHLSAWKALFDAYLRERARLRGEEFVPFSAESDYPAFVDGRPRYDGVRAFLQSRGIELAFGESSDLPNQETICGLGNGKDRLFVELLERQGADVFPETVAFIENVRNSDVSCAVGSSSRNCGRILDSVRLTDLFAAVVDGVTAATLNLPGKPSPAVFFECARLLGVSPARCVVIEDAISGVEAGRSGGFALTIGIDRGAGARELRLAGADIVLNDLNQVTAGDVDVWIASKQAGR
jgi:beta-phosphoglucomutase family hydrolase